MHYTKLRSLFDFSITKHTGNDLFSFLPNIHLFRKKNSQFSWLFWIIALKKCNFHYFSTKFSVWMQKLMPFNKKNKILTNQTYKIMKFRFSSVKSHQIFVDEFFQFFLFYKKNDYYQQSLLKKFWPIFCRQKFVEKRQKPLK